MEKNDIKSWKFRAIVITALLLLAFGIITSIAMSCSTIKGWVDRYPSDNIVEEVAEEVIEHYTGADLDLSPGSPEK